MKTLVDDNHKPVKKKVKVVVFHNPQADRLKRARSIDDVWSQLVSYVMDHPKDAGNRKLFGRFGQAVGQSYRDFTNDLLSRNIPRLRELVIKRKKRASRGLKRADSLQLTESVVEVFQKERKRKAIIHLSRMDTVINNSTTIIEKESENLIKMDSKVAGLHIGRHLANTTTLHKLASSVYGIDQESDQDKAKQNLAIIMGFTPEPIRKLDNTAPPIDI